MHADVQALRQKNNFREHYTTPIMKDSNSANDFISTTPRAMPGYVYELADYEHERLLSFVPIHAGDFVSFKLTDGTFIRERKVKRVCHYPSLASASGQLLSAVLEFAEASMVPGGSR